MGSKLYNEAIEYINKSELFELDERNTIIVWVILLLLRILSRHGDGDRWKHLYQLS